MRSRSSPERAIVDDYLARLPGSTTWLSSYAGPRGLGGALVAHPLDTGTNGIWRLVS